MGKGSKIKGLGSSWMKQHATNLLKYMPVDDIASGKGPGKHGVHKSMAKHGEPKGQGPGKHHPGMPEYGKPKGPGKHHPDGPMKHGMMHDGPGDYGDTYGNEKMREKTKFTPSGKRKGPRKTGVLDLDSLTDEDFKVDSPVNPNVTATHETIGTYEEGTLYGENKYGGVKRPNERQPSGWNKGTITSGAGNQFTMKKGDKLDKQMKVKVDGQTLPIEVKTTALGDTKISKHPDFATIDSTKERNFRNAIFKTPVNVTTAYNKPIKKDTGTAMKGKVYGHGPLKYGYTKNK